MTTRRANIAMRCWPMHSGLRQACRGRPPNDFQCCLRGGLRRSPDRRPPDELPRRFRAATMVLPPAQTRRRLMTIEVRNIFALEPPATPDEQLTMLLTGANMHLERIVSHAHASPEGFWYDQEWAEWVIVL